ncbi:MAG: hypothetical protein JJ975_16645 [Bacteroidia bacterium]|nr:hypothetical protein [Bacteroidia bacterium]
MYQNLALIDLPGYYLVWSLGPTVSHCSF